MNNKKFDRAAISTQRASTDAGVNTSMSASIQHNYINLIDNCYEERVRSTVRGGSRRLNVDVVGTVLVFSVRSPVTVPPSSSQLLSNIDFVRETRSYDGRTIPRDLLCREYSGLDGRLQLRFVHSTLNWTELNSVVGGVA